MGYSEAHVWTPQHTRYEFRCSRYVLDDGTVRYDPACERCQAEAAESPRPLGVPVRELLG